MSPKKVLVTGVYGLIAGEVFNHLQARPDQYEVYGLARRRHPSNRVAEGRALAIPNDHFILSDLSDLEQVTEAVSGMDVVVHLAADPSGQRGWDSVLQSNIIGAYNIFEGCRQAGVKRIVFASTIQVSMGYRAKETPYNLISQGNYDQVPADYPKVAAEWPTRPMNIYASSKIWGEALARTYADSHGLSCLCIRIGWVVKEDKPPHPAAQDIWCSIRDIVQIHKRCVNAPDDLNFGIFYGMSDNKWRWVDIDHAGQAIGYDPQDRAEDHLSL